MLHGYRVQFSILASFLRSFYSFLSGLRGSTDWHYRRRTVRKPFRIETRIIGFLFRLFEALGLDLSVIRAFYRR